MKEKKEKLKSAIKYTKEIAEIFKLQKELVDKLMTYSANKLEKINNNIDEEQVLFASHYATVNTCINILLDAIPPKDREQVLEIALETEVKGIQQ